MAESEAQRTVTEDESPTGSAAHGVPVDGDVLRAAAARAAELSGGAALLFTCESPGQGARLRAAAGVTSPTAARAAARELEPVVARVSERGAPERIAPPASLGKRGCAGGGALPLRIDGRTHGVLVVALPAPLPPSASAALESLASELGARLELAACRAEYDALRERLREQTRVAEQKSEEVLKLSEALFAQDIELLRSQEKLGSVERLKNDFIEKMSRELRTPLNSIIEGIIAVLAGENEALSESAKETLRRALDDGTAFLRTLQNILDLWRIKQGELPVEIQEVSFPEVVEEAIFSVQDALSGRPVAIETRIPPAMPKIRTDLAKLSQIVFLVLDNAVKFTPEGRIEIAAELEEGRLVCTISDTGVGIAPDDQQFVFDEFYQVDELGDGSYRGAGLGLTLVRELLRLLDGAISLSSEVGQGTRVRFQLPVEVVG